MQNFEGKTAVITGAASGIGLALAERAAEARMNVVLADIEEKALEHAVQRIEARQVRAIGVPSNTMIEESVREVAERAIDEFGKVHLVCNNAGVASTVNAGKPVWEIPDRDWDWVMGVNFYGVLYGIRAFVPHMLEHGESAHIVNTASLAALLPGGGTYGVSKHGVLALTEGLQRDFADRGANINASVEESLARIKPVIRDAKAAGCAVRGYVSTAFGCPYDGDVEPAAGARVARTLLDAGADEVSLADTIGVAVPRDVEAVLDACEAMGIPLDAIALHFHDTRGTALANVHTGMRRGITTFDSSAGGLGGCPFAPGATGNLPTEDLVYFLDQMEIESGVSLDGIARASLAVAEALGRPLVSRAHVAWAAWATR